MTNESRLLPLLAAGILCGWSVQAEEVKVWELPDGAKAGDRSGWKAGELTSAFKSGAALQNGNVVVIVAVGDAGAIIQSMKAGITAGAAVNIVPAKGGAAKVEKITLTKKDDMESVLRLKCGTGEADVKLRAGQTSIEVAPVSGVEAIEVRSKTAYALLPDFFGFDTVYDAKRFKSGSLMAPAENFLLSLEEGGDAMVMCVWQGTLSLGKKEEAAKDASDPRVDIFFSGETPNRKIERMHIEFAGKSVFVAVLACKGIWLDLDVSDWKAQEPRELSWKRPFEAKWRATFLGKEGAWCKDLFSITLSNDAWFPGECGWWSASSPQPRTSLQGLWPHFIYPFYINKDKTFINLYADMDERKSGKPKNMFDRAIIYPIDRRKDTPIGELTLVDVVRETLGVGPCEYVLDVQGLRSRPQGGSRETLAGASCNSYDEHVVHFVKARTGQDTNYQVDGKPLKGLKPGERFSPEMEARLVQVLEDINLFISAVNVRLKEYRDFSDKLAAFCDSESRRAPQVKPLADGLAAKIKQLQTRTDRELPGLNKEFADWFVRINKIIDEVKAGNYANIHVPSSGTLGDGTADHQDILVCFQRRVIKGIRTEASSVDSTDPEVVKFAAKVRGLCQGALRNKHELEGW